LRYAVNSELAEADLADIWVEIAAYDMRQLAARWTRYPCPTDCEPLWHSRTVSREDG